MNKKIIGIGVFIFALIFGQSVFADSDDCTCGEKMKEMITSLKLDDAQQAKIKVIKEQMKSSVKSNWEKMKGLREQINQQIHSDDMDSSKVDQLINLKAELMGKMMKAKAMARHQMYGLLTPQQKVQFQELFKKWDEKVEKKHESCHKDDSND